MNNRKIGIVTFHMAENFGSALQAFALERVLEENGYQSEIINCILKSDMEQYKLFRTQYYKVRPRAFIGDILYFFRNFARKYNFSRFRKKYLLISSQLYKLGLDDLIGLNEKYDTFICGSDQIWNLNCINGFIPEFFLSFADNTKKKIAYAPSMPTTVPQKYYSSLRKAVNRLNAVSVREGQTIQYLREEVGVEKKIVKVVDPTLLLNSDYYVKTFKLINKKEKFLFVYILQDEKMQELIEYAAKISNLTSLKIKYVFFRKVKEFDTAEYIFGIGPDEFLEMIYNATYVITNSFHATVFSILFKIPFCVFQRSNSQSRMVELLEAVNMQQNLYSPNNVAWMNSHSEDRTETNIKQLSKESLEFLLSSLG